MLTFVLGFGYYVGIGFDLMVDWMCDCCLDCALILVVFFGFIVLVCLYCLFGALLVNFTGLFCLVVAFVSLFRVILVVYFLFVF